ncbi:MAG: DNA polymerase III subunit alpha, partial [Bacteroidales bacterium]|nr:DNA polymerase III subunit alpha [Bacteroidales bacterium]
VMRHETKIPGLSKEVFIQQQMVNEKIFELGEKLGIKVIASNDVHFVKAEDGPAHDRLICLTTNELYDSPSRLHYTQEEYLKSQEQMAELFSDHPEVVTNTMEIAEKIETYNIDSDPILPKFELPEEFLADIDSYLEKYKEIIDEGRCDKHGTPRGEEFEHSVAYLCHLCYKGAEIRYGKLSPEAEERIVFELKTICKMGFPDYFLIVRDFIKAARDMGIWVGPGRGSAAGSVVAYCLWITNVDPLRYDLLFERFLNPDRISMPDIDIDFDDEGRAEVYRYVERKYGKDHISHVVTFGTMAAKSAIKDVARIHEIPLDVSNALTKLVPDRDFEKEVADPEDKTKKITKKIKINLPNCIEHVPEFKSAYDEADSKVKEVVDFATRLEGSIRQTGVHACATIIGRGNLSDYIPLSTVKDKVTGEDLLVSQYEGSFIEEVGMLKMDFLGLRTLSIQKECLKNIRQSRGIEIDLEAIPLDDKPTYDLFGRGDTIAVFQFESPGMQKYLRELKPTNLEDIIAMNALYRPGPMDYIPDFIARKQGVKPITYDIPVMEKYLKDTYGITVYQEQVMLLSRLLAGFTRGQSDTLRKAMGKKIKSKLDELNPLFLEGGQKNGHDVEVLKKIWGDWEKFASYAFNKSHATCYAWVAYQTAYLKANYPAEFMAANMSCSLGNMDEIIKLMDDCKRSNIKLLGPDVNESSTGFSVNKDGNIRFGLAGIKGVGSGIIDVIIETREKGGAFKDIFDFIERVKGTKINSKIIECLVAAGTFDCFTELSRAQYSAPVGNTGMTFIEALLKYKDNLQNDKFSSGMSLFGDMQEIKPVRPEYPLSVDADQMEILKNEKEMVGMYLSAHPLDKYRFELDHFANCSLSGIAEISARISQDAEAVAKGAAKIADTVLDKTFWVAGIVTSADVRLTKTNRQMCRLTVEDFNGSFTFMLFGKTYENFMQYCKVNEALLIKCAVEKKFAKKDSQEPPRYDLSIKEMHLLSTVKDTFIKEFHINVPVEVLSDKFTKELASVCRRNKGESRLFVNLFDRTKDLQVEFFSKKYFVSPDEELLTFLKLNNIPYNIQKAKL